jgi:hypothetical protein
MSGEGRRFIFGARDHLLEQPGSREP